MAEGSHFEQESLALASMARDDSRKQHGGRQQHVGRSSTAANAR